MRHASCRRGPLATLLAWAVAAPALGQEPASGAAGDLASGDVAWLLTSSAIVLLMTVPGLALFYGGLVRGRNVLSVMMQCFVTAALVSVTWVLWGYSLAFGPDRGGLVGDLSYFALAGVSHEAGPGENVPQQAFMIFQLMFAIITPALIVGAVAERIKFSAFLLFVLLWSTFVYSPLAHWVWAPGGWLFERGALDFAGGTVVHISSGTSALVAAAVLGRRRGYGRDPMPPHSLPFTVAGASLLWVGWFGFNAGSALGANALATLAFVNTNTATGAAVLGWMVSEWIGRGKPTALGVATGAVAGLVAITPAAGFVEPKAALGIGAVAGFLCYKACNWKHRVGYDDALDVVGVHGVGGTWGALATGLFASQAMNSAGRNGLFYGNPDQLWIQAIGVGATYAFCAFGTALILGLVNSLVGLRVTQDDEELGLDLALHSESAYTGTGAATPLRERSHAPALRPPAPAEAVRQPPARSPSVQRRPPASVPRPAPVGAPSLAPLGDAEGPFRIVVEGIDPGELSRWWNDLCVKAQNPSSVPEAFREIYPNVRLFDGNTIHFSRGDAGATRERLALLLDLHGADVSALHVESG